MGVHKIWKKFTDSWIGSVILGVVFAFLFYQFLGIALGTELPVVAVVSASMQHDNADVTYYQWLQNKYGYNRSYVNSWPITGGFAIGDMPIVQRSNNYQVGDVIVYDAGQKAPIIHRVVAINADGTYQTKGDNNRDQLPYELSVRKEQIYGKVIFIVPKLGYVKVLTSQIIGV